MFNHIILAHEYNDACLSFYSGKKALEMKSITIAMFNIRLAEGAEG